MIAWGFYLVPSVQGNNLVPVSVPADLADVVAIACGRVGSYAVKVDGTAVVWTTGSSYEDPNVAEPVRAAVYEPDLLPVELSNVGAIADGLALIDDRAPVLHASIGSPRQDATGFHCSIPTQSGRVYRLEHCQSLTNPQWTALPLPAGNGRVATLSDSTVDQRTRFYRVRRIPAWLVHPPSPATGVRPSFSGFLPMR